MHLGRIEGSITMTVAHPSARGWRMAIYQPIDETGAPQGDPLLAVDPHQAAHGQRVIVSTDGQATRGKVEDERSPLRNMVIGIVDG